MKIAVAQIEISNGQALENFQHLRRLIGEAKEKGQEMIVFPELCLSGHLLNDLWFNADFVAELESYNDKICALSEDITIIWGNVIRSDNQLYNVAFIAQNGKYQRAVDNKTYYVYAAANQADTFNDRRYFANWLLVPTAACFTLAKDTKVCLTAGEYWLSQKQLPSAEVIVNIVNSPYRLNKKEQRAKALQSWSVKATVVYCNNLGLENNGKNFFVYDGDCQIYRQGQLLARDSGEYIPGLLREKSEKTVSSEDELIKVLLYALRTFDRLLLNGQMKWIVGLSGGLDSSISAALLVLALGKEKVIAYNLPTANNSEKTKNNARSLAATLGIEYHEVAIDALVEESLKALQLTTRNEIETLTQENIQARLRGHLLSGYAAHNKGVVINNGNKLEVALGYYTLYGDSIGALALLGDLLKVELFELASQINRHCKKTVIPENLIPKRENYSYIFNVAPSAELKKEQVDPMKWGYHDLLLQQLLSPSGLQLEKLLRQYLENSWQGSELGCWKDSYFDNDADFIADLRWFLKSIKSTVFKRVQAIPLLSLTETSFGGAYWENQGGRLISERGEELLALIEKRK